MAQESKNENRKQRIREAFHDGKQVERMPAREDMAPQHSDDVIYRVAPYCRVSTMSEMQAESFEIQQQYYNEYIAKHPNWTLVRIYADEGISATSVKNRKDFNNMIEDCKAGKIDLIVTKSVSRFARTVDSADDCCCLFSSLIRLCPFSWARAAFEEQCAPHTESYRRHPYRESSRQSAVHIACTRKSHLSSLRYRRGR